MSCDEKVLIQVTTGSVQLDDTELNRLESTSLHPLCRRMLMFFQDQYTSLNPRMYFDVMVSA
jgi:ABC-type microcin C transport system duplicated ATPase subunit YejF